MTIYNMGMDNVVSTDAGAEAFAITSTEEEKKKVRRIVITDITTQPIAITVTLEREKICDNIPLEAVADLMPERIIELDIEIPVGQTLKGVITPQTAATQGYIDGWVEYEIIG